MPLLKGGRRPGNGDVGALNGAGHQGMVTCVSQSSASAPVLADAGGDFGSCCSKSSRQSMVPGRSGWCWRIRQHVGCVGGQVVVVGVDQQLQLQLHAQGQRL